MRDEENTERRTPRPRPVRPPVVAEGPLRELKSLLYELYAHAGAPATDEIADEIKQDDFLPDAPSGDTVRRILSEPALPRRAEAVVSVATVLARRAGRDERAVVDSVRQLWASALTRETGRAPAPPSPPAQAPSSGGSRWFFQHLLDYHTEKFAGRDGEVSAIRDHIDGHDRGYVFVDGLSGYGKTSLLAVLIRQQPGYLYHFISQRYKTAGGAFDPTRLDDLLSNLCEQLEPHRAAPIGGRALAARFLEVVENDRENPTVLVLDAIDEVDRHPSFLLGLLPRRLPKNLFVLLSARSQGDRSYLSEVGLTPDDIGLRVTLGGLDTDAVRQLLLHHAGPAGAALGRRAGFVDALHDVSEGDPFYLRFLVEDVEHGRLTPENIRRTPNGLHPYLDEQFEHLHRSVDSRLHDKVLGLILEAYGPLHRSDLLRNVPGLTGGTLEQVVRDVQRFLLRTGEQSYTFCHNRFREYFREKH
ncbi:ATP-binding protein [Streptomyces sp. NBC_01231]|nr:ATP-binding protein [Streptomyces sp. NBC_01231]WSQ15317.1 ATP-binding protein [Streptomyces sp. NBC_01231]